MSFAALADPSRSARGTPPTFAWRTNNDRFIRTASIAPGKFTEAIAFAKQVTDYIGKKHGLRLEVMLPVGGNPQRIAWRTEYESLGAMEAAQTKLLADTKYLELIVKGTNNFIAGSLNDSIWRTI